MPAPPAGGRLPAEWEPQSGVMLTWPHPATDWAPRVAEAESVLLAIAREVTRHERLVVACHDPAHYAHVTDRLAAAGIPAERLRLGLAPSNDSWARDHGPITVICDRRPWLLDFVFNGWGGKYPADVDDRITATLHLAGLLGDGPLHRVDMVLEGGAIEVDGRGTLLTTERALLAPTRNPGLDRGTAEQRLGALLGVERVLWLTAGGLAGDDTDGHIDTLARFCDPHTIAHVSCDDPLDVHYADLQAMGVELRALPDSEGQPYRLVPLPLPAPQRDADGNQLPASYANFLIINGAVLIPTYGDPADEVALRLLQGCFPDREVVAIDCLPLIHQFGSLHCMTMQLPAGVLA